MSNQKFPTNDEGLNKFITQLAKEACEYGRRGVEGNVEGKPTPSEAELDGTAERFLDWYFVHLNTVDPRQYEKDLLTFDTYARAAAKTESIDFAAILARVTGTDLEHLRDRFPAQAKDLEARADTAAPGLRIFHAVLGMASEAGEAVDAVKKHLFYGKPLDKVNLVEEAGDMLWYLGILSLALQTPLAEIAQLNINKLEARYGEKFTEQGATVRDLDTERAVLEDAQDDSDAFPACPQCDTNDQVITGTLLHVWYCEECKHNFTALQAETRQKFLAEHGTENDGDATRVVRPHAGEGINDTGARTGRTQCETPNESALPADYMDIPYTYKPCMICNITEVRTDVQPRVCKACFEAAMPNHKD